MAELNLDTPLLQDPITGSQHVGSIVWPVVSVLVFLGIIVISYRKSRDSKFQFERFALADWPVVLKLCLIPFVLSLLGTHFFAALTVYYQTRIAQLTTPEYWANVGVGKLLSNSHAHLFAHATLYLSMTFLFFLSRAPNNSKRIFPFLALWGAIFDILSWWATKYWGAEWEILSAVSGTAFTFSFLFMAFYILRDCRSVTSTP
jgi:hypothetical protein